MKEYREDDRSTEFCDVCRKMVTTVMRRQDYQPEGFAEAITGLLVATCEVCGTALSLPAQSVARVAAERSGKA